MAGADLTQSPVSSRGTADPGEWEWRNCPLEKQFLDPSRGGGSGDVK